MSKYSPTAYHCIEEPSAHFTTYGGRHIMGENRFSCGSSSHSPKEMISIETNRILDSCRDRDCFENVKVIFM